jgi:hypothetical protein
MRFFAWMCLALVLASCGSIDPVPVKTGGDLDELRKSPCACGGPIEAASQWTG